jgi:thymidylate kinase
MIIIVEGTDKSGKSTLIRDLIKSIPEVVVFKLSPGNKPRGDDPEQIVKVKASYAELFYQAQMLSEQGKHVIFDRAYPSERVYSIKRGYDAMKDTDWGRFESELNKENILLVYCFVDEKIQMNRMDAEREDYLQKSELKAMNQRYERFLELTQLRKIFIDSSHDQRENVKLVLKHIQ